MSIISKVGYKTVYKTGNSSVVTVTGLCNCGDRLYRCFDYKNKAIVFLPTEIAEKLGKDNMQIQKVYTFLLYPAYPRVELQNGGQL